MMFFYAFIPVATLIATTGAELVSPPTDIYLILPAAGSKVNVNQTLQMGFVDQNAPGSVHVSRDILMTAKRPGDTSSSYRRLKPALQKCASKVDTSTSAASDVIDFFDVVGLYTVTYNYTYAFSSDPTLDNFTSCAPGPFSFQSIIFDRNIEVADLGKGVTTPATTVTTTLPTAPTGKVSVPDSTKSRSSSSTISGPTGSPSPKGSASTLRNSGVALIGSVILGIMFDFA